MEQQRKARDSLLRGRDSCQPRAGVGSRKLCQVPGSWGTGHSGPYLQQVQRDGHGLQFPQQVHGSLLEGEGRTLVNDLEVSVGKLSSSHTRGLGEHEAVTDWRSTWGQMPREGRHEKGAAVHLTPAQGPQGPSGERAEAHPQQGRRPHLPGPTSPAHVAQAASPQCRLLGPSPQGPLLPSRAPHAPCSLPPAASPRLDGCARTPSPFSVRHPCPHLLPRSRIHRGHTAPQQTKLPRALRGLSCPPRDPLLPLPATRLPHSPSKALCK